MKHINEKQHINAAMTFSNEKKNRTTMNPTMKQKNKKTTILQTIIQQSFNNKKMKHTNETRK